MMHACHGGSPGAGLGFECADRAACREPFICTFGRCRSPCLVDAECPRGLCVPYPGGERASVCTLSTEADCEARGCPDGLVCDPSGLCRPGCEQVRCEAPAVCERGVCLQPASGGAGGGAASAGAAGASGAQQTGGSGGAEPEGPLEPPYPALGSSFDPAIADKPDGAIIVANNDRPLAELSGATPVFADTRSGKVAALDLSTSCSVGGVRLTTIDLALPSPSPADQRCITAAPGATYVSLSPEGHALCVNVRRPAQRDDLSCGLIAAPGEPFKTTLSGETGQGWDAPLLLGRGPSPFAFWRDPDNLLFRGPISASMTVGASTGATVTPETGEMVGEEAWLVVSDPTSPATHRWARFRAAGLTLQPLPTLPGAGGGSPFWSALALPRGALFARSEIGFTSLFVLRDDDSLGGRLIANSAGANGVRMVALDGGGVLVVTGHGTTGEMLATRVDPAGAVTTPSTVVAKGSSPTPRLVVASPRGDIDVIYTQKLQGFERLEVRAVTLRIDPR